MKKIMLFIVIAVFVSCSNTNSKLENSLSKEIGKEPIQNELVSGTKTQIVLWEDVEMGKSSLIKNLVDKEFGSLPSEVSDLNQELDDEYNPIDGAYYQYQVYENTKNKVELSFRYSNTKPDLMNVRLYMTIK